MKRHFNTHIEGIDLKFWHDLMVAHGELMTLKKGDYLCREGVPTNLCGFVKSGYLIYRTRGMSKQSGIGGFAFAGALCGDYPNCLYNAPACLDLVAGRKTEIWVIDAMILPSMYDKNVEYAHHGRVFMEAAYSSLLRRYNSLCAHDATERYINLVREHPQIEQDVPQSEIARYLHISPTHLCRIRRKLNQP